MMPRRLLVARSVRAVAVLVAVLGVIDPSFQRSQKVKPEIAVIALGVSSTPALVEEVSRALGKSFSLIRAPFGAAAATVLVGDTPPENAAELSAPTFVVLPTRLPTEARIVGVRHRTALSTSRGGMVYVDMDVSADKGDSLVVSLLNNGVFIDRNASHAAEPLRLRRITVPLEFVPSDSGTQLLTAQAHVVHSGTSYAGSIASFAINANAARRQILFVDKRPSWMSTFVRRALERDADMLVSSRVTTSRGVSTISGSPPSLADAGSLASFDVIVVGSPEALSVREISNLESFLRDRGGSVLLLLNARASGPYEKLVRNNDWIGRTEGKAIGLTDAQRPSASASTLASKSALTSASALASALDSGRVVKAGLSDADSVSLLRVSDWIAPRVVPPGATAVLRIGGDVGSPNEGPAVIWRTNVGVGTMMVSGALDAWRFRDSATSRFDEFWRSNVATLAAAAVPTVALSLAPTVAAPGSPVELRALLRNARKASSESASGSASASASAAVTVSALLERFVDSTVDIVTANGRGLDPRFTAQSLRVWPTATAGVVKANFTAPSKPGWYRVVFQVGRDSAETELVVADSVTPSLMSNESMMRMLASSHGGSAVNESDLASLNAIVSNGIREAERRSPWYPMRSGLWIVPFAALLSLEWYIRRMSGLA